MTSLVCGNRSVLAWHMQLQAAQAGHTLEVVDPRVFLATIPTDDDIDVICDDAENDDANSGTSSLPAGSPIGSPVAVDNATAANGAADENATWNDTAETVSGAVVAAGNSSCPSFHSDSLIYLADARLWTPQDPSHTPTDTELAQEIRATTEAVVNVIETLPVMPATVVLASSISAGNTTEVGQALAEAAVLIEQATSGAATRYMELQFPQVFGEGFPAMKGALIAQLCDAISAGKHPRVSQDRPMTIMYAQEAARILTNEMPDLAMSMAESSKEPTGQLAITLNEISNMSVDGHIPDRIPSSRYGLVFQLYSTLRTAQLRVAQLRNGENGRHILPKLPTSTVIEELPRVTSRTHFLQPGSTVEIQGTLNGLHRLAVVAGTAELTLPNFPGIVFVAAADKLPEEDQPSTAQAIAQDLADDYPVAEPQGMPFFDVPHGYTVRCECKKNGSAQGGNPVAIVEWVSEP